jgi:hypothetical protein
MGRMLELFKRMWLAWHGMTSRLLVAQNAVLMLLAYIVGLGPVALGMRLVGHDPIDRSGPDPRAPSYWRPRDGKPIDMHRASRQF